MLALPPHPSQAGPGHRSGTRSGRAGPAARVAAALLALAPWTAGAHTAGLERVAVPYFDTTIDVAVWYPADAAEQRVEAGPFSPSAAAGAPPAEGRYPLVLLSHGTGGMNLNHHTLAGALARAGFVVAAPTHPGDNFRDRGLIADPRYFDERPRQLGAVLDYLLEQTSWSSRIDASRIGAMGHSAGGYAVAALAGMRADRERLAAHCRGGDDPACAYADPSFGVADPRPDPFRLPPGPVAGDGPGDDRVRAAVLLAPLAAVLADDARPRAGVRLKVIRAGKDEVLPADAHAHRLRRLAPGAEHATAEGAGHFSFIAPVAARWRPLLGVIANDPEGFDRGAFHDALSQSLVAWFRDALDVR